jgi:hypothetical protein
MFSFSELHGRQAPDKPRCDIAQRAVAIRVSKPGGRSEVDRSIATNAAWFNPKELDNAARRALAILAALFA